MKTKPHTKLEQVFAGKESWEIALVISGYTGGKCTRIEELDELQAIHLADIYEPQLSETQQLALKEVQLKKEWISNILAKAEKTGLKEAGSWEKFNGWMMRSSKYKKHLNAHTLEELKEVHRQICSVGTNNRRSEKRGLTDSFWKKGEAIKLWN